MVRYLTAAGNLLDFFNFGVMLNSIHRGANPINFTGGFKCQNYNQR
jgi:hypothetical protein